MRKSFLESIKNELSILRTLFHRRIYINPRIEKDIIKQFHRLYYDSQAQGGTWEKTFWLGIQTLKCPLDLWIYQELVFEEKPDFIIETGTSHGGSALFLACICDIIGHGNIITIDIEKKENRPQHKRIQYLLGSSISEDILKQVTKLIGDYDKVIVILDSDHHKEHVLKELKIYSNFIRKGSHIIVEDTNINGHPVLSDFGPGPMEAVKEFLSKNDNFTIDITREKFYLTFNPNGFLKRIR